MRDACVLEDRADHEDDKKNNNDDDKDSTIIYTLENVKVCFVSFRIRRLMETLRPKNRTS